MNKKTLIDKLDDYEIHLRENEELSKKTVHKYIVDINRLIEFLKDENKRITKVDLLDWKEQLEEESIYSASTINGFFISAVKYFKWIDKKTKLRIKPVKIQRKTSIENVLTNVEIDKMKRIAKRNNMLDTYFLIRVLSESGIRVSELKFITVENIKKKYITVKNKGKYRDIFLPSDLKRDLRKYCEEVGINTGYVFASTKKHGKHIVPSTVWRKIQKVGRMSRGISVDKLHPHSLRHLFAKNYMDQNNDNHIELADILGHEDVRTTAIYTQTTKEEKQKKVDLIRKKASDEI